MLTLWLGRFAAMACRTSNQPVRSASNHLGPVSALGRVGSMFWLGFSFVLFVYNGCRWAVGLAALLERR